MTSPDDEAAEGEGDFSTMTISSSGNPMAAEILEGNKTITVNGRRESNENNILDYQEKMRQANQSCRLRVEELSRSSMDQTHVHPPTKLVVICATVNSTAATSAILNAWCSLLGLLPPSATQAEVACKN